MQIHVEIPEPKTNGLDAALAKQFADIQQQLMRMIGAKDDSAKAMHQLILESMEEQQSSLVSALERLMGLVGKAQGSNGTASALAGALQGLKRTLADLPGDLKEALDQQYQRVQVGMTKTELRPSVTVRMPQGLLSRIDSLESALLNGLRRSRSRTFGSNY